jgi:hypothetical protein
MPASDFLPFATSLGANVLSQVGYAALAQRTDGFSPGVAHSAWVNKAIRQAAFVASGVAGFMLNKLGADILDDGDLPGFVTDLTNALIATIAGHNAYYTAGGTANAITVTTDPATTALVNGQMFGVRIASQNTGAVTLNAGAGAKALRRNDDAALVTGELVAGQDILVIYDATSDHYRLVGMTIAQMLAHYDYYLAAGSANALTIVTTPPTAGFANGQRFFIRCSANNTGAATLDVGAGAKSLLRSDGGAVVAGDLRNGQNVEVVYDSNSDAYRLDGLRPSQLATGSLVANGLGGLTLDIDGQTSKSAQSTDEIIVWDVGLGGLPQGHGQLNRRQRLV